jgi:hypothetical protein
MGPEAKDVSNSFGRLGELVRSVGSGHVPKAVDALGEHRVTETFERTRKGQARGRIAGLGAVVAAMAVAALVVSSAHQSATALSWTVEGSSSSDTAYVSPSSSKQAKVRFSEGSEFEVEPGSRLRIAEAGRKAVKAVLETGASRVRIASRSTVGWKIEAGPFSVSPGAVASLMVEWIADELLRVSIFEGETSVTGTPSPLFLRAGQRLSANAKDGTVEVGPIAAVLPLGPSASAAIDSGPLDEPGPPHGTASAVSPALAPPGGSKRLSWTDSVAAGDYAAVLLDAERRGVSAVLGEGSLSELVALADAARLSGRNDLARRALLSQRARFPRAGAAKDAAFFLGRIADDHELSPASAIPWYDTYLSEAPHGHFAAEAFGRKMVAISKQSGRSAAKDMAAEYLKRFPSGPHVSVARELLSE